MTTTLPLSQEVFDFPCEYPLKIFGKDCAALRATICGIIEQHTDKLRPDQITLKRSAKGRYVAFTIRIIADNRVQLDALNRDLQHCPLVAYVL